MPEEIPFRAERILFVSLSCVGDVVMTTPVLQALHEHYDSAVIDIVADRRSSILFRNCPYAGDILHKEKDRLLRGALALLREVRKHRYDLIVDLRTDGLAYLFRGGRRLTKWNAGAYGPHSVERMMGVIRKIHGDRPIPKSRIWLGDAEERFADGFLSTMAGGTLLALGPGSGGARERKAWPARSYAALANALADRVSGVVIAGGPNEKALAAAVAGELELPHVDLTDTNLLEAAAVLGRTDYFVGSDSGLGHIAAAMSVPTLSLFGPGDPERYRPWGDRAEWMIAPRRDLMSLQVRDVYDRLISHASGYGTLPP